MDGPTRMNGCRIEPPIGGELQMYAIIAAWQAGGDGLTFGEVLGNVPTDAASVFVYLLVLVSLGAIAWANRPRRRRRRVG